MAYIGVLDCNNFFVSCERLFRPDLAKRPVAVLSSNDGCIVARSQEIKDLGIPMGVPYFQVKDICMQAKAVLFSSNFALYRDISTRVMQALQDEVGACEMYSIDEAFFAVPTTTTESELLIMRQSIMERTGIPVSIGIGPTKTIAKQASKQAKKGNGVSILDIDTWQGLTGTIACAEIWGIGRQLSTRLRSRGVATVSEELALPHPQVRTLFGVVGERLQSELSGVSVHAVGAGIHEPHQSIMSTRSFAKTVTKRSDLESAISYHVDAVAKKLREEKLLTTRMSVSIRPSRHGEYAGTHGHKDVEFSYPTASTQVLTQAALAAVRDVFVSAISYKKAGIVLTALVPEQYVPRSLFSETEISDTSVLDSVTDALNERYGNNTIHLASLRSGGSLTSATLRSPAYTTQWNDIPTVSA